MACEYCIKIGGKHDSRCPLYEEPKVTHYCSVCNEGIYDGEEYIENDIGEYAHWECIDYGRDLAKWLGYEIKTMEGNDEENY